MMKCSSFFDSDDPTFNYVTTHVFLPVQVPEESDYTIENDLSLACAASNAAHAYSAHIDDALKPRWNSIEKMLDNLQVSVQFGQLRKGDVISQLRSMRSGDVLAFLIRPQRAAVIFRKQDNHTLYESFEVSPSRDAMLCTPGSLIYIYPQSATIEVPNNVFDDPHFQTELGNFLARPGDADADPPNVPASHPEYITALLNGILRSVGRTVETSGVRKRIRDEIGKPQGEELEDEWRRSSLWLLIRVAIQTSLDRSSLGRVTYKVFMIFFICGLANDANNADLSGDLLYLMSAKILRRLRKLGSSAPPWISDMALKTCTCLQDTLDVRAMEIQNTKPRSPYWNPSELDLANDTRLSLVHSNKYIRNALANHVPPETLPHPKSYLRGTLRDFLSDISFFDRAYTADPYIALYDLEQSVEEGIDDWVAHATDVDEACIQLGSLVEVYLSSASIPYRDNPEYRSIMILTAIELWVALDKLVIRVIPILAEYSPEIPIWLLQSLLLRETMNLHRLSRIYLYLAARYSQACAGLSVLSDEFAQDSFPVRYYDNSPALQNFKARFKEGVICKMVEDEAAEKGVASLVLTLRNGISRPKDRNTKDRQLDEGVEVSKSLLPISSMHAKVIVFELQCPLPFRVWRSSTAHLLYRFDNARIKPFSIEPQSKSHDFLSDIPELRSHLVEHLHKKSPTHSQFNLAFFYSQGLHYKNPRLGYAFEWALPRFEYSKWQGIGDGHLSQHTTYYDFFAGCTNHARQSKGLATYVRTTTHTPNDVLSAQTDCPRDFSLDEFITLGHLRSGSSLQWINILCALRGRTLNFRSHEVHFLLTEAISQVGPLDMVSGEWVWHQELQNHSFCDTLLNELESLFLDVAVGSLDQVTMHTISLLLTRVLASSPCESTSERALLLLRKIRTKTLEWAQELAYNLTWEPMNKERRVCLYNMAAACRSTFDVNASALPKLFLSAQDVDALLSCAFFSQATDGASEFPEHKEFGCVACHLTSSDVRDYSKLLHQRDCRLSIILERKLKDAIQTDASDRGIDLAVRNLWPSYRPGPERWDPAQHPDSHQLACTTAASGDGGPQLMHINLLNESLLVDGRLLGRLPRQIQEHPSYKQIFDGQTLAVAPSNLSGMDFVTLATISDHHVHFSLRDEDLVIRAQCRKTDVILELIPSEKLKGDLPAFFIQNHVHWLIPSESAIEIRPLKHIWERSEENWRIVVHPDGGCHMFKDSKSLVDMKSRTWIMISSLLDCLVLPEDLVVTTTTSTANGLSSTQLSVDLPYYGLSFFVNENGDLQSRDFRDMIYDDNQCIGTLFGLVNRLVLRAKNEVEAGIIPRYILVPTDAFEHRDTPRDYLPSVSGRITYHAYTVDTDLGRLTGDPSQLSKSFLAYLHAKTSVDWTPDPLTSRTGAREALSILQSAGFRSHLIRNYLPIIPSELDGRYPQLWIAVDETILQDIYSYKSNIRRMRGARRAAYMFPPDFMASALPEDFGDRDCVPSILHLELESTVCTAASVVSSFCWPVAVGVPIINTIVTWTEMWGNIMSGPAVHPPSSYDGTLWDPELPEVLLTKVHKVLQEGSDGSSTSTPSRPKSQLLFVLPTAAYCSSHPQVAFLSMLLAFADGQQTLENRSSYVNYKILDGFCLTDKVLRHLIYASRYSDRAWDENLAQNGIDATIRCLLRAWPSDTIPTFSLGSELDIWDVAGLTQALQALFSSCYRNLKLKENITHILQREPAISRAARIQLITSSVTYESIPPPGPSLVSSLQCTSEPSPHVTLDQLFSARRPPILPNLAKLPIHNSYASDGRSPSSDPLALDRLYSVLRTGKVDLPFRERYITHLHASARRVREEDEMMYGTKSYLDVEELKRHFLRCRCRRTDALQILKDSLGPAANPLEQALHRSGNWPQVTIDTLLRCLATTSPTKLSKGWTECLVSFALLLLELQRSRRLLQFGSEGLEEELSKELLNEGCDGWNAEQYPDWLLIQLQGNFLIRRSQLNIALEMISPQSGESTIMQVKMGEGKSSVIIPITAAVLANGHQLTRVVVPKALKQQMFYLLVDRLGGFANRLIYDLFFSRQFDNYGDDPYQKLCECMDKHGILIVQPEDIVSLKLTSVEKQLPGHKLVADLSSKSQLVHNSNVALKSLESLSDRSYLANLLLGLCNSPNYSTLKEAMGMIPDASRDNAHTALGTSRYLNLQKWLHCHARDILDESDEIFHPRFQLIYTIGHQRHMDGYPDRWTITQQTLKLVKRHASSLSMSLPDSVEYKLSQPGSFPYFRISRTSDAGRRLILLLLEDVMADHLPAFSFQRLSEMQRDTIREFLSTEHVQLDKAKEVEEYARQSQQNNLWGGLLLLRGLFACNILLFTLTERRWRVDYGLLSDRYRLLTRYTRLAVPYRAKDVPAPNTQFGHPDITILFTCLSYYYTGLDKAQLRLSFQTLLDEDDPAAEYALWIKDCGSASVPSALLNFGKFNLESSEQWDKYLFPTFSRNQAAIDFYLSRIVFPKEGKEFPRKLAGSSWDLAEKKERPITGFSGTNDSRYLLPESVTQRDLEHQQGTNARVLGYLLQPENDSYMRIPHGDSKSKMSREFLKTVVDQTPQIRVLLDVGAQILDVSNREFVEEWLELSGSDIAGAIYFNERDELNVLTRNRATLPLMASPLSQQLDRCVIYLDDSHTRGTDLRFPNGFRAAVTLGPKVTKDRLVQGCMRMRKLGNGHSVMFFAPLEVDLNIRSITHKEDPNVPITSADILRWAIHETWTDIEQRAPHWAKQGIDHQRRYDAWSRYCNDELTADQLADTWLQPDIKSLADLYAPCEARNTPETMVLSDLEKYIGRQCEYLGVAKSSNHSIQMDEQLEREVNREIERERQEELPPKAEPAPHILHPDVAYFVKTGILRASSAFRPVFTALEESSAASTQKGVWSSFILATADFCETIKEIPPGGRADQYLRPVQWVLSGRKGRDRVLVVVSPFEAHHLMPDIRVSSHVHLHVYVPRTKERMKPTDDLTFYSIPPVPDDWIPPWDLIDQLNIFAGQLYLRDYDAYRRLCDFLAIQRKAQKDRLERAGRYNLFNLVHRGELDKVHPDSLLPSVMMLLAIRRRGLPFSESHMGKILQGRPLTKADFERPTPDGSSGSKCAPPFVSEDYDEDYVLCHVEDCY